MLSFTRLRSKVPHVLIEIHFHVRDSQSGADYPPMGGRQHAHLVFLLLKYWE